MKSLGIHRLTPEVHLPEFATAGSACFDVRAFISDTHIKHYTGSNFEFKLEPFFDRASDKYYIHIDPYQRCLVPTGLILDIPNGYSVRLHPRSGLALKFGINLMNCEGIIDSDYVDPLYVILYNNSTVPAKVYDGERICQGELVKNIECKIYETDKRPLQKTKRTGGFGSTGK